MEEKENKNPEKPNQKVMRLEAKIKDLTNSKQAAIDNKLPQEEIDKIQQEIDATQHRIDMSLGKVEKTIKPRKDILEEKYNEYNSKYGNASKEEMQEKLDNLEKELEGKKAALENCDNEEKREKIQASIAKAEQEKNNVSGYIKNRQKIDKIRNYKQQLNGKLEVFKSRKQELEDTISNKQKDIKVYHTHLKTKDEEYKEVVKNLNDPKYTENLDQNQYNELCLKKEKLEKDKQDMLKGLAKVEEEIRNSKAELKEAEHKIETLLRGISKCNLAWKSLFTDKTWDEIHARALDGRYIRVTTNGKKQEKDKDKDQDKDQDNGEDNSLAEYKLSFMQKLRKIKNTFIKIGHKIVNFIWQDEEYDENFGEWLDEDLKGPTKPVKKEKQEKTAKKEEKVEKVEEEKSTDMSRDAFIEALREIVENDKSVKEQAYIEKHKAKAKTNVKEEQKERE